VVEGGIGGMKMKHAILALVFAVFLLASANAAVSLSANTPDPIYQGESTTVTVTATASGSSASNVTITIGLPAGISASGSESQMIASLSAGQSQSVNWTVQGDTASSNPYTITFNASGGATASTTTQLSVLTPPFIEVENFTCPASDANVGDDLTVRFTLKNTGGDSTNAQVDMSYSASYFTLKAGSDPWNGDINAGGQIALSYDFNAIDAGTKTITAAIASNQNNPDDNSCSITITGVCGDGLCSSDESCSSCSTDCGACPTPTPTPTPVLGAGNGPSSSPTPTPTATPSETETVFEQEFVERANEEELRDVLEQAGFSEGEIAEAIEAHENVEIVREIKVEKITTGEEVSYKTTLSITVKNNSDKKWNDVKVVEIIPKNVLEAVSEEDISSALDFRILEADPILEFTVPEIMPGETATLEYTFAQDTNSEQAASFGKPVVASFTEEELDLCEGVECEKKECKRERCNPKSGKCLYSNAEDGTPCEGGECRDGVCVSLVEATPEASPTPAPSAGGIDWLFIGGIVGIALAVVVIAVLGGYYLYTRREKGKTPLELLGKRQKHLKGHERHKERPEVPESED